MITKRELLKTKEQKEVIEALRKMDRELDVIMEGKSSEELWIVCMMVHGLRSGKGKKSFWFSEEASSLFDALLDRVNQAAKDKKGITLKGRKVSYG